MTEIFYIEHRFSTRLGDHVSVTEAHTTLAAARAAVAQIGGGGLEIIRGELDTGGHSALPKAIFYVQDRGHRVSGKTFYSTRRRASARAATFADEVTSIEVQETPLYTASD